MRQIDLNGKNALITGGTRGIGRAISITLADAGACVAAIYRSDTETAEKTQAALGAPPDCPEHFLLKADIADETQVADAVRQAVERFGGALDILVLDAAQSSSGPLIDSTTEDWRKNFAVNTDGAFFMVRAAAPYIRPGGSIIFISSGAGHDALEGLAAYGASKAALNHLAGVLALELGPKGIRVNVVSPGHTEKDNMNINSDPSRYTEGQKRLAESTSLRRIGTAQDVANVVLFYVSDLAGFVTGHWTRVNGGRA